MTDKPWKLVLLLTGIFLAGSVVGGFVSLAVARSMVRERLAPEMWGPNRLKMIEKRLQLTPEQVERLKPIIRRDVEELTKLRQQGFQEARRVVERMEKDIASVLTPEQAVKYEKLNAELREKARRMFEQQKRDRDRPDKGERRGPPPGGKDGMPPPPDGPPPGEPGKD